MAKSLSKPRVPTGRHKKSGGRKRPCKHIFVTGGVVSSLGKGITAASIGRLLVNMGFSVRIQKLDPYLNVDPGTMNPFQHGEVYVTDDGAECDLDLGHYERFLDQPCSKQSTVTSGQVYQRVLHNERAGKYNGGTVQVIPHITNEIKASIDALADDDVDVVITEIGGTVGDIEGLPFMEAVRQFRHEKGRANVALCHVAYIPYIKAAGEIKTKPAQHSVQKLREIGLIPDFLFCRTEHKLGREIKEKLSLFCNVDFANVIELADTQHAIYEVPQVMVKQQLPTLMTERLGLPERECEMREWDLMIRHIKNPKATVRIGLIGKYIDHQDAYKSVTEAIDHAAWAHLMQAEIVRIEAGDLERDPDWEEKLGELHGIVVPGGFGKRGFEGKLMAIRYAREHALPFLGLCLGMQAACVEFARNVLELESANSQEFDAKTDNPIIVLMESQKEIVDLGGTMRLGNYDCTMTRKSSKVAKSYGGADLVGERHRHRYEFNNEYKEQFEAAGMTFPGIHILDPDQPEIHLVEMIELREHPWFVATQAHPEFKSSPVAPHPLFKGMLGAVAKSL